MVLIMVIIMDDIDTGRSNNDVDIDHNSDDDDAHACPPVVVNSKRHSHESNCMNDTCVAVAAADAAAVAASVALFQLRHL